MKLKKPTILPIPVRRALRKLGHDIRTRRRRRILPVWLRSVHRSAALHGEHRKGRSWRGHGPLFDCSLRHGNGLGDGETFADPRNDNVGLQLEEERCRSEFALRERSGKLSNGMRDRSFTPDLAGKPCCSGRVLGLVGKEARVRSRCGRNRVV